MSELNLSKYPAIEILKKLNYEVISPKEALELRGGYYNTVLTPILQRNLVRINEYEYKGKKYKFSERSINQAIKDINIDLSNGVIKANEYISNMLLSGKSYAEDLIDKNVQSFNIRYIDLDNPQNNEYHVVEEFFVEKEDGTGKLRPDLVLFINGIPFCVIECKAPDIDVNEAIGQMRRNQSKNGILNLFKYSQILIATNKNEVKYATCNTPKKFWSIWKEENEAWLQAQISRVVEGRIPTTQDKNLVSLLHPDRVIEFLKYFILFDKNVKKIARYQQYFAVKEIFKRVTSRNDKGVRSSGVVWHTQGSGKSLTMVMATKYIMDNVKAIAPRVIIVTDREELDDQIHTTFNNTRLKALRAKSGSHLISLIKDEGADIVTTLVHKFNKVFDKAVVEESEDIFILVDEGHRTQFGGLNAKMKNVFPNASYIAFTGTPLMKKQKNNVKRFGEMIHKYTITDAVEDKAIVPLLYEGRMVEQCINNKAIDNRIEILTKDLNDTQKDKFNSKWSKFKKIASTEQRLFLIADDINKHFMNEYKSQDSVFKGMLACSSKSDAVNYLNIFEGFGDLNVGVVISPIDDREYFEEVGDSKEEVINFWNEMMNKYGSYKAYEKALKNEFKYGDIDILIVVDKLLTGFDAPKATVMYIDKEMKEHTLLQAIARVNRLYEGKDFGFIIDYRGLFEKLDDAMNMYSGDNLSGFDLDDIKGSVKSILSIVSSLRQSYTDLIGMFITIKNKEDSEEYEILLGDEKLRGKFYTELSIFSRNLAVALQSQEVYKAVDKEELDKYKQSFIFYQKLRRYVKLRYADDIDHKSYEEKMRKLMNTHIISEELIRITPPTDILNSRACDKEIETLNTSGAKADYIASRLTKSININKNSDPIYYKKFSEKVQKAIDEYKERRISEAEYLNKMKDLRLKYIGAEDDTNYPYSIRNNSNSKAFYKVLHELLNKKIENDLLGQISLDLDKILIKYIKPDWRENIDIHSKISQDIDDLFYDLEKEKGIVLSLDEVDKIIESVLQISRNRY